MRPPCQVRQGPCGPADRSTASRGGGDPGTCRRLQKEVWPASLSVCISEQMPACAGGGLTRVIVVCPTDLRCRLYTRVGLRNFLAFLLSALSAVKRAREIACAVSPIAVAAISTIVMLCDTFKELRGDRKATTPTSATGGEKMPLPWNEAMSAFRQVQCLPQRPKWARNAAVRSLMRGRRLRRADRFVLPRARTDCCRDVHFLGQNSRIMYRLEGATLG